MDQGRLRAGVRWAERAPERQIMRQTERERVSLALCVVEVLDRVFLGFASHPNVTSGPLTV